MFFWLPIETTEVSVRKILTERSERVMNIGLELDADVCIENDPYLV